MIIHVALAEHGGGTPEALCGATVKGVYYGGVKRLAQAPNLCRECKMLALKIAANAGHEAAFSAEAGHYDHSRARRSIEVS